VLLTTAHTNTLGVAGYGDFGARRPNEEPTSTTGYRINGVTLRVATLSTPPNSADEGASGLETSTNIVIFASVRNSFRNSTLGLLGSSS